MHNLLKEFIDSKMEVASSFVTRYLPVNLPDNEIYEGLVGEPHVLEAFRNAVRYLPPAAVNKHATVKLGDETLNVHLRLSPTDKYPTFLLPKYDLYVSHGSELGQAMALARKVAGEWDTLTRVWERFKFAVDDAHVLGFVFPWLKEMFIDFTMDKLPMRPKLVSERAVLMRDVANINQRIPPSHFPRMSPDLNVICQSGKRLFGQYRMLDAAMRDADIARASLTISNATNKLVPQWVTEHANEALADWQVECEAIRRDKKRR